MTDITIQDGELAKLPDKVVIITARKVHGRVDHVFANVGVGPRADGLSMTVDATGDLVEATLVIVDMNFKAAIYTATIAVYYMRDGQAWKPVVCKRSSLTAKLPRAAYPREFVCPFVGQDWLHVLPFMQSIGVEPQKPIVIAKGATFLMANES
ncbi:hort-chain dehydrogenase/reductase ascJ [Emericellopsis cladophorae]|uniref:Hort-chain dehydrogenase/reductase ascJ n=1 Tax=Emericellopsis cladophorae TaxID=2686198 RepID=A0A9P9Y067_9HYPO|nr:hort-chain dehydrogenase/reductase ascJ [Emericellopsis cladophorae]KAI6780925.1 hort-chain dehydrogenase/reductase ascJ [Emericellopsis cladophorae]